MSTRKLIAPGKRGAQNGIVRWSPVFIVADNQDRANAKDQAAKAVHAVRGTYTLGEGGMVHTR